jgi:hypothetical protein
MNTRFLRPNVVWSAIWIAMVILMGSIAYWQSNLYWENSIERVQKHEFKVLHAVLPYAIAFLEEHGQIGLLKGALSSDQELFTLVYTDLTGAIKYPPRFAGLPAAKIAFLKNYKFSYVYKRPVPGNNSGPIPSGGEGAGGVSKTSKESEAYGKLYLLANEPPTLGETFWNRNYFRRGWLGESFLDFTIIGYFLVLVGFTAICSISARFQSHFQSALEDQHRSELETRDLRIQVLESNLKTLDLRLEILDQEHEKALGTSNKARKAIDRLVKKLQSEETKNEELERKLGKAQLEHNQALRAIQTINADIARIAAEKRELENLRQAEQTEDADHYRDYGKRPKEFLWLNLVYKNLRFSRRALQNIIGMQYGHDVFPSLPDALSLINNSKVESLLSGEGIPSRSVVRYTQPLSHFHGLLWEYRFSKDGRIFFGLSQSRTWNIDTILLKRHFSDNRQKYEKYLENTLGKGNKDLSPQLD